MKTPKKKRKEQKSYGQTAKRGALWSIIRQGGHELIAVPMSVIMARLLTPADFGVAVAASFFILLASRVTQLGFGAAIVRIKELRPEHTSSVFVVSFLLGVSNYIVLFLAAPFIGRFFQSAEAGELVRVAALTFLITPFGSVANALNSRHMQFRYIALADWTDTLVGAVATVGLAMRGWGYWSITYGQILATSVTVVLKMYLAGWRPSLQFSRAAVRELLPYGLGVQTKRALEYVSANADNLVVGRMLDMTALGFYDKAFSTMNRLVNRLTLGQAPFRIFAIIHEDRERFQRAYTRLILSITMIGYPVLVVCIIAAGPLFHVLYGARWASASVPFQFLCFGGMLKLLNNYASQANEAAGAIWYQARRQAVGTVLVVIGAAVGASRGGILGAAIGVTVAMVLLTVAMQDLVRRATGLTWREMFTPQVPALVCSTLVGGAAWIVGALLMRRVPQVRPAVVLAAQAGVALLCYAAFVLFNRFAELRSVVDETLHEALPASVIRRLNRFGLAMLPPAQS